MTFRILLVEDNPGDVYLIEKALSSRGISYQLTCYEDGELALSALSHDDWGKPDLILLDLHLPRRDGFDVLQTVRTRPGLVGVPVGMLTSSNADSDRHRIGLLGAERYIHKPSTLDEFVDQVGQAVEELLGRKPER